MMIDAPTLHRDAIVIDAVCPLVKQPGAFVDWYVEGGCTAIAPTVAAWEDATFAIRNIGAWLDFIARRDDLRLIRFAADIEAAKAAGQLGIVLHFQGTDPIGDDLNLVTLYKALGVGVMQLAYNVRNRIGDGAQERSDSGLSRFGMDFVKRCNRDRVIVDCSHTGYRTTMEAIALSERPVIFSHANPRAVHPSPRNITDEQIKAVAETGGTVGVVGFPGFVSTSARPTLAQFIAHIDHIAGLVGIDHVSLGIDYFAGQHPVMDDAAARKRYESLVAAGLWEPDGYPPPPYYYPEGIETPRTLQNLTAGLAAHGYGEADIRKVLGGNLMRVYRAVWGG